MPMPLILVVEDRKADQYVIQHLLTRFNYDSEVVSSGESALQSLDNKCYSAILMNVTLPGMTGIACAHKIRATRSVMVYTPIIAVTAKNEDEIRALCLGAGMDDYLSKPFSPQQLREVVARYVPAI
jgi:CheY-like chemotaxis protein